MCSGCFRTMTEITEWCLIDEVKQSNTIDEIQGERSTIAVACAVSQPIAISAPGDQPAGVSSWPKGTLRGSNHRIAFAESACPHCLYVMYDSHSIFV